METKFRNVFWGVILLILGIVLALKNFGIISFSWRALLQLWPVLLILWGISVIPARASLKVILALFVAILSVALVYYKSPQYEDKPWWQWNENTEWNEEDWTAEEQVLAEPWDTAVKRVELKLEAGAGKFEIADTTQSLIYFHRSGNVGPYVLESYDDEEGRKLHINVQKSNFDLGSVKNEVNIRLNPEPLWDMEIKAGAAELNVDLSKYKVRNCEISSGAASAILKMGATLDSAQVKIEMGAASVKVLVPREVGCQIKSESVLSSRKFPGFDKLKSGLYQTPGFDHARKKIFLDVKSAVSDLSVEQY
ncbi:MAG: LiaI-LiaF-like domain-containing protein [Bacteroidales bacterium]